jgi:hypothetical protein
MSITRRQMLHALGATGVLAGAGHFLSSLAADRKLIVTIYGGCYKGTCRCHATVEP